MGALRIKRLAATDTAELVAAAHLFDSPPLEEAARGYLRDERCVFLLAYDGPDVAGFVRGTLLPQIEMPQPQLFLYEIDVAPAFQRRGIAKALVGALAAIARKAGCNEMFVFTNRSNDAAMRLYATTGGVTEADDEQMFVYKFDG
jgi:ribosomal protein S18 acetylase RimI-like enzyme